MYSYYRTGYYPYSKSPYVRGNSKEDGRGLLLPLLFGAAVGFPIGYIASNTNKNNQGYGYPYPVYPQPYVQQPYPVYPQQYPMVPQMPYY